MRDSLKPGDNEQKEYNVLVGGTGVATAKGATFKLGTASTTPTGFTATFVDDEAPAGEALTGTEITLPAITNNSPNTRYYVGWAIDGDEDEVIYKAGTKVTIEENTKFIAMHYPKGDITIVDGKGDGVVDSSDAELAYYMELNDTESILDMGYEAFWTEEDEYGAEYGDITLVEEDDIIVGDGVVDSSDAELAYYMELCDTESILEMGYAQFWED